MRTAIPAIQTGDESLNRVLEAMKMNLDGITGQTSNSDKLVALDKTATPLKLVNLVNLLAKRLGLDGVTSVQELTNFLSDAAGSVADYKASVRVASTAAINLAAPGATIDGVTMAVGDRFLEKDNATASARGIYIWNGAAVAATRATDADGAGELTSGSIVAVEEGDANGDSLWMLATDGAIIIGTTALTFKRKDEPPITVRQTVLSGPVDSNGFAAFGGNTGSTTVTASGTLVATASRETGGRTSSITNPSWTGLSTNGTMYLYLEIDAAGVCTTGSTALAPNYQWGGAYSITNGQHTFNIQEMTMKVGNGAAASQVWRVFVGEVTVAAGVTSAITWYALMGRYIAPWTATIPAGGSPVSFNHNTGISDLMTKLEIQCTTADAGYSVGETVTEVNGNSGGVAVPISIWRTAKAIGFVVAPSSNLLVQHKSTGSNTVVTNASWKYRLVAQRSW